MTCAEFRRIRDEAALDTYRKRWPVLQRKEQALRAEIQHLEATETPKAINDAKFDKSGLYYQLQDVTSEMQWIEIDAQVRKANLGIVEAA